MQRFLAVFQAMDLNRRVFFAGGLAAFIVFAVILGRMVMTPTMSLLYSGLEGAQAGEVIEAIQARGVQYEVRGDAIYVDIQQRDALRMSLAGEGLPAGASSGYEILDQLQGFGTTAQMFDAAYWRAKEGELERTIAASPFARSARVHIANASTNPFSAQQSISASVALQPVSGAIPSSFARAVRHLVASAIPNLEVSDVTIIDATSGNLLDSDLEGAAGREGTTRAEMLQRNIQRIVGARVGPNNAVVEVSVELRHESERLIERRIDPDSRVVVSSDTHETTQQLNNSTSGNVTVASNLPEGDAEGAEGGNSSQESSERTATVYDLSETQREVEIQPGEIKRISVAILVNGVETIDEDGIATINPRTDEELEQLESLVRSTIGFNEARGDQITILSMEFDQTTASELAAAAESTNSIFSAFDLNKMVQFIILGAVTLAIAFGVLRPALVGGAQSTGSTALVTGPDDQFGSANGQADLSNDPDDASLDMLPPLGSLGGGDGGGWDGEIISAATPVADDEDADPVARLRRLIQERETETVEILRSWMEADEEETSS